MHTKNQTSSVTNSAPPVFGMRLFKANAHRGTGISNIFAFIAGHQHPCIENPLGPTSGQVRILWRPFQKELLELYSYPKRKNAPIDEVPFLPAPGDEDADLMHNCIPSPRVSSPYKHGYHLSTSMIGHP